MLSLVIILLDLFGEEKPFSSGFDQGACTLSLSVDLSLLFLLDKTLF